MSIELSNKILYYMNVINAKDPADGSVKNLKYFSW